MKRFFMNVRRLGYLFVGVVFLVLTGFSAQSTGGVDINIGIYAPPPPFVVPAPPPVILIPETYVYYVPDIEVDILFYHGYWYRPHEGRWYIAQHYNGPWGYLAPQKVPRDLIRLPPNYHNIPPGHQRIPHEDLKKNWGRWERERHLERGEGLRGEGPRGHGGREREKGLR